MKRPVRRRCSLGAVAAHDLTQKKHAILRNFPVIGHARSPSSDSVRSCASTSSPATTRSGRSAATSAAGSTPRPSCENNYFGFGTDNDLENAAGYPIIKHRTFTGPGRTPSHADEARPAVRQGARRPPRPAPGFRPESVVNISGMSFGVLSGNADRGAEPRRRHGRLPAQHRRGCDSRRTTAGRRHRLPDRDGLLRLPRRDGRLRPGPAQGLVASAPVRAIEIKLRQGAKPGLGGMLPAPR